MHSVRGYDADPSANNMPLKKRKPASSPSAGAGKGNADPGTGGKKQKRITGGGGSGMGWMNTQKKRREVDKLNRDLYKTDQLLASLGDPELAASLTHDAFEKQLALLETAVGNDPMQYPLKIAACLQREKG